MSKKVTAVTNAVYVGGHNLVRASDGSVRVVDSNTKRGADVGNADSALTAKGVKALKKALPLLKEAVDLSSKMRKLESRIEAMSSGDTGLSDFDGLNFSTEDGDVYVAVGCTTLDNEYITEAIKKLGL